MSAERLVNTWYLGLQERISTWFGVRAMLDLRNYRKLVQQPVGLLHGGTALDWADRCEDRAEARQATPFRLVSLDGMGVADQDFTGWVPVLFEAVDPVAIWLADVVSTSPTRGHVVCVLVDQASRTARGVCCPDGVDGLVRDLAAFRARADGLPARDTLAFSEFTFLRAGFAPDPLQVTRRPPVRTPIAPADLATKNARVQDAVGDLASFLVDGQELQEEGAQETKGGDEPPRVEELAEEPAPAPKLALEEAAGDWDVPGFAIQAAEVVDGAGAAARQLAEADGGARVVNWRAEDISLLDSAGVCFRDLLQLLPRLLTAYERELASLPPDDRTPELVMVGRLLGKDRDLDRLLRARDGFVAGMLVRDPAERARRLEMFRTAIISGAELEEILEDERRQMTDSDEDRAEFQARLRHVVEQVEREINLCIDRAGYTAHRDVHLRDDDFRDIPEDPLTDDHVASEQSSERRPGAGVLPMAQLRSATTQVRTIERRVLARAAGVGAGAGSVV